MAIVGRNDGDPIMTACFLVTFFGTVVYLDEISLLLRHGKVGEVPANVTASRVGDSVQLMLIGNVRNEPISDLGPQGCRFVPGDRSVLELQLHSHSRPPTHVLSWSGRLLTAELDGSMSLARDAVGDWEAFLLIGAVEFGELEFIVGNCWIQRAPLRVFRHSDVSLNEGFELRFGDVALDLAAMLRLLAGSAECRPSTTLEFEAAYDGWKLLSLRLFRPLVYLVAYGRDDVFECASIAIQSVQRLGGWPADIALITDRFHAATVGLVSAQPSRFAVGSVCG
jgi:hypothetical protein